jgi:hypothetical protein
VSSSGAAAAGRLSCHVTEFGERCFSADALGIVTSGDEELASCRKTVATLIDGGGLSARVGADHLGHTNVSMTQDKYMARGRSHAEVADLLDRAINDE